MGSRLDLVPVNYWNVFHEEYHARHTSRGRLMCCPSSANHVETENLMFRTNQIHVGVPTKIR